MLNNKAVKKYIAMSTCFLMVLALAVVMPQGNVHATGALAQDAEEAETLETAGAAPQTVSVDKQASGDTKQDRDKTGVYTAKADIRITEGVDEDRAQPPVEQGEEQPVMVANSALEEASVEDTAVLEAPVVSREIETEGEEYDGDDDTSVQPTDTLPYSVSAGGINNVKLEDWSVMNKLIVKYKKNIALEVIDVRTGIKYNVYRMGGDEHCDVETLTEADTAAMKQTFGGKWSGDRRPIWIKVNEQYYAASIMGSPHGQDTVPGNGMSGQVCIHFKGSKMHNPHRVCERHQAAVQEAYAKGNELAQYSAPPQPPRQQNPWEQDTPEL